MSGSWFAWLPFVRRYLAFSAGAHLIWEFGHMPLYTLWYEATAGEIVYAAVHCTVGDVMIAGTSLVLSLLIVGAVRRPVECHTGLITVTLVTGLAYTIFSEWLNTEIRGSWAYAELMPVVPVIGAGLSPLVQWIVVPVVGLIWTRRTVCEGP